MRFSIPQSAASLAVICLSICITPTLSHSWVEQLYLVSSNGSYVGAPGFVRNFIPRNLPSFSDTAAEHKVPPDGRPTGSQILSTDMMCRPGQTLGSQTSGFPALAAAPEDNVAMHFTENGHVTLFSTQRGKPSGRGTVFVYGTSKPLATDTYLDIHRVWNADGTGGDKRGKLLSTSQFDDGRCFQVNSSPLAASRAAAIGMTKGDMAEIPCQAAVQIPSDAPTSGLYTMYWVWEWPTVDNNGKIVTNESYTSCMDIAMKGKSSVNTDGKFEVVQAAASNANALAIQAQLNTQFLVNPTAAAQPANDNPLTGNPAPAASTTSPAATTPTARASTSAPAPAPAPTSAAANPVAGGSSGLVTVTVTQQEHYTVTVTRDSPSTPVSVASALSTPATSSSSNPIPTTLQKSTSVSKPTTSFTNISTNAGAYPTETSVPAVTPFLAAGSSIVQEPPARRLVRLRGRTVVL